MSGVVIKDTKEFLYEIQKNKSPSEVIVNNASVLMERKNVLDLKIVVCVDISGSISQTQFNQFMRQIDAIRGLSMVKVIETDDKVVAMYDYFKENKNRVVRLGGGGGTAFGEAFRWCKKLKPDAILFMTDGEVFDSVSDPGIPTGWVLTSDGRKPYGFGKVVLQLPPPYSSYAE